MTRKTAVYVRISRDRVGAGLGVQRQEEDCRELAAKLGWSVVEVYSDNDLSAYSTRKRRPGYQQMLADLKSGRADAVIAWHTDRLHRRPLELEDYISVCELHQVPTHCVKAGPLDLTTPSGRLVARQLGAVARYEVEHAIERQKRAKLQAATDGKFRGGRRPFGYEADGVTVRVGEAGELAKAADLVLAGESLSSIARDWNARGLRGTLGGQWDGATLHDVLSRWRNAGLIEHDGKVVGEANWPAVIDPDTFSALRSMLKDPSRRRSKSNSRVQLGAGLFLCGVCADGTTMRTTGGRRGVVDDYRYRRAYRCTTSAHVTRVAETVDAFVRGVVLKRLAAPDAGNILAKDASEDTKPLHAKRSALSTRLDELAGLFAEGVIEARQLTEGTRQLREQIGQLEARIARASSGSVLVGILGSDSPADFWDALSVDRRRAIVDALMTVTINKAPRGRRPGGGYFTGDAIAIAWRV